MLPPEGVALAAARWLDLLQRSDVEQAWDIIRADSDYVDLTPTQYALALDWLLGIGVLDVGKTGTALSEHAQNIELEELLEVTYAFGLEHDPPAWLADADVLVDRPEALPADAVALANALGLDDARAFAGVRQVHGRIDLERRAEVGSAGELALVAELKKVWPGEVVHIAEEHDGWGYDVSAVNSDASFHIEVKSTTRRGRLSVHLSRQEFEIAQLDSSWHLVVIGLDDHHNLTSAATVRKGVLPGRSPEDTSPDTKWQSARYDFDVGDLEPGLPFLQAWVANTHPSSALVTGVALGQEAFEWMPPT